METKKCTKCNLEKNTCDFYKNSKSKDGLKSWCIECHKKDSKSREEQYNKKRRLYRLTHKEESKEKKKVYYIENKDKILLDNALWRQTFKGRLLSYKRAAEKRGIEWGLTDDEFQTFWGLPCSYCGDEIETIGIDRIENDKGYHLKNCTPCCTTCNTLKMTMDKNIFIEKIKQIIKNLNIEL